jgi:hypothetical protein
MYFHGRTGPGALEQRDPGLAHQLARAHFLLGVLTLVEGQAIIQGARSAQESLGEACDGRGEVAIFRTTAYRSIDTGQHQTLVAALT